MDSPLETFCAAATGADDGGGRDSDFDFWTDLIFFKFFTASLNSFVFAQSLDGLLVSFKIVFCVIPASFNALYILFLFSL